MAQEHRNYRWRLSAAVALVAMLAAAAQPAPRVRRAKPPTFSKSITDAFFPDAREKLAGPRPDPGTITKATPVPPAKPVDASAPASIGPGGWSRLIEASAVEDEIKSQQNRLAKVVQNATRFRGGEFRQARTSLGVLTAMTAIVAEYDDKIRFKDQAAALRDQLGAAALACKDGSEAAFKQAKARSDDLQLLVRGGSLSLPAGAKSADWSRLADRPSLMKRLEEAQQQVLGPSVANEQQFKRNADALAQNAAIVAALSEIMTRPGFEFADDDTYVEYARAMQAHAVALQSAAKQGNYEAARAAEGELRQSCATCHDGYR